MKLKDKIVAVSQRAGIAVLMASSYGFVAKAQPSEVDIGVGQISRVPMLGEDDLETFLGNAINLILIIAGVAAVAYLIWGGLTYITAGGDSEKASKGRTSITNAIIGIIIIMGSLAIYNWLIKAAAPGVS